MPLFRTPLLLALLLATAFVAGCDSDDLDDHAGGTDVRVTTFDLRNFDRDFSTSGNEVQYEESFSHLTERAVDDGIVLLYASDVINENGLRRDGWSPLPLTIGVDEPTQDNPDGDGFVDYTLTTTYTYDIGRLYVNLVASDNFTIDFLDETQGLLADFEALTFRLVTIPGGGFNRGLDYSDYEAVQRAYNLPD